MNAEKIRGLLRELLQSMRDYHFRAETAAEDLETNNNMNGADDGDMSEHSKGFQRIPSETEPIYIRDGTDSLPFRFLFSFFSQDCRKLHVGLALIESILLQPFTHRLSSVEKAVGRFTLILSQSGSYKLSI